MKAVRHGADKLWKVGLRRDCLHQRLHSEDLYRSLQVVGQHMQTHFRADLGQGLHQEMRRAHPGLERAEGMFDRLPSQARRLRCTVESTLHPVEHTFVFPASDPAIWARGASALERASRA